jgi:hypothetical protein
MPGMEGPSVFGHRGQRVATRLRRQPEVSTHLAVLLPGLGYRSTMPALYYCCQLMFQRGADVLSMEYAYDSVPDFMSASDEEKLSWIKDDVGAAFDAIASSQIGHHRRFTIIGKSLGTVGMALTVPDYPELRTADLIWLTPSFGAPGLYEGLLRCCESGCRSILVIGTADPAYDDKQLDELKDRFGVNLMVVPGLDHGLEIAGDVAATVDAMALIMRGLTDWVTHPT